MLQINNDLNSGEMHLGSKSESLPSICGDLLAGEFQNGVNFYFEVQFDLQGQGQAPHKAIGILRVQLT